jgi:hypothetical protein
VISRPTIFARDLRVGDRLLVIRAEIADVIPALPAVSNVRQDSRGQVVVSLVERAGRPLLLQADALITVERVRR